MATSYGTCRPRPPPVPPARTGEERAACRYTTHDPLPSQPPPAPHPPHGRRTPCVVADARLSPSLAHPQHDGRREGTKATHGLVDLGLWPPPPSQAARPPPQREGGESHRPPAGGGEAQQTAGTRTRETQHLPNARPRLTLEMTPGTRNQWRPPRAPTGHVTKGPPGPFREDVNTRGLVRASGERHQVRAGVSSQRAGHPPSPRRHQWGRCTRQSCCHALVGARYQQIWHTDCHWSVAQTQTQQTRLFSRYATRAVDRATSTVRRQLSLPRAGGSGWHPCRGSRTYVT